ncbi:hypothetical protein R3P38DRAFT_2809041 [Favolaschia claudopus]|uniref:Uncharacterized protein n=1 Tax=Favolaschia claudopus TaxID=2862362 RepID=A0AAV9ZE49_9AGAR
MRVVSRVAAAILLEFFATISLPSTRGTGDNEVYPFEWNSLEQWLKRPLLVAMLARAFSGVLRERRVGVFAGPDGSIKYWQLYGKQLIDSQYERGRTVLAEFCRSAWQNGNCRISAETPKCEPFWVKNLTREKSLKSSRGSRLPVLSSDDPRQGLAGCREPLESL